jgi:hypothetical protein
MAFARAFLRQAQQKYEKQANRLRRPIDWQTRNKIYVRKSNWTTDRPSDGLDNPYLGPYKVLSNPYSNVYKIDFFPNIKARRFLNASRLMKTWDNAMPGQILIPPNPVEINDKLKWIVDKILFSRLHYQKLQYKIVWKGHDPDPE